MTSTASFGNSFSDLFARFGAGAKRAVALGASAVFAMLLVMTAGVVAIATAIAGLLLALAALVVRFASHRQRASASEKTPETQGVVLEARRTSRGWTVE